MNRNIALILAAALLAGPITNAYAIDTPANCPVGAPSLLVDHAQTSLGSETLLVCPYDAGTGGHPFITRTYHVSNNTGTPWTDYHFGLSLALPAGVAPLAGFGWDPPSLNPVIGSVVQDDDLHVSVFFAQPLGAGGDFSIDLRFGEYNVGTVTVTGTPSIPEPGTLALAAFALAGLGWSRRRRA